MNNRFWLVVACLSVPSATVLAQQDRIAGPVDRFQRIALKGNIHPNSDPRFDAGPVDPSIALDHVMLMLKRSPAQQADLDRLLAAQQDRSSRNYHAWLTPEQFGDRFGVSSNDIAQVVSWLQSEGLAVDGIARARNWVWFSGTVGQVQTALHTELRRYTVDGESHFANASDPSVPAAIGPLVTGILGLDDFKPKPGQSRRVRVTSESAPNSSLLQVTDPVENHFLTPNDFAIIYNLTPLYNAGYDGSGQKIVVAGQSAVDLADIRAFRDEFGLSQNDPQLVLAPSGPDPGRNSTMGEADLDIEWAGAVARNATIIYVYSANALGISVPYAIDQNFAPVITLSFGLCERLESPSFRATVQAWAQQANAQGITWVAASGDSGAAGCDPHSRASQASQGLAVSFPASLPEVTAVGGTQFDEAGGAYWSDISSSTLASARSYIPEKGWNESDATGLASGGGGLSSFFPKPSWQNAPGVPGANFRAVPDVSLSAAFHDGYRVFSGGVPYFVDYGTSAGTPSFAGILALVNQYQELNGVETRSGQGNINPNLYSLAQATPGVFHDITSGDNIVPCVAGTPDCSTGTFGYTAGPGYDLVTGLGSVDGFNLAVGLATQWNTPAISGLNPGSVIALAGDFILAVTGSGFDSGSVVQWKGTPLATTFVNGTELRAMVSGDLIPVQGSADITVLGSQGVSAPATLVISASFGASFSNQRMIAISTQSCVVPTAVSSFSASDTAYLYFNAQVTPSDVFTTDWLAPNGAVVRGDTFLPFPQPLSFCVGGPQLTLANTTFNPAGTWQARVFDHGILLFSVPFTVTVPGNQTTPLAHAADGNGFKTTVLLTNTGAGPAPYTLRFNDDHGNVPATRFELEEGSLTGIVPPGRPVTIRTAGLGTAIVNGWAELTAPASVGGSVIYSQRTGLPSIQEGTATIVATGSQHFFLPFDNTAKAITGVALTNPGASAASNVSVAFRYSDGSPTETVSYPQLPGRNHQAFALDSPFPHTANRSGVAEFTSDVPLYAVVFRFNSTGAYTALDVTSAGADATVITRPLAHAADGNGFKTTVLLTNAGSAPAPYTLRFNDDQGNTPATRFELEAGSSLTGVIPAGGSATIRTAGLGDAIVNGWAELTAPGLVGGSVIYSQKTGLPSIQEGTATIVASGSTHFFLPFDNTAGAITGVAITNPGASGANNIGVTFRYSNGGADDAVSYPQLASRNHQAFALSGQFPQTADKKGVAEFTSDVPLSAVVFRFNSTGAFTSLEIVTP